MMKKPPARVVSIRRCDAKMDQAFIEPREQLRIKFGNAVSGWHEGEEKKLRRRRFGMLNVIGDEGCCVETIFDPTRKGTKVLFS